MQTTETRRWRFKGPEMEGPIARWYARVRGSESQLEAYRNQAVHLTADLPDGARVLEVAPGPGDRRVPPRRCGPNAVRNRVLRPGRLPGGVQELHAATQRARRDASRSSRRRGGGDPGHESGGNPRRHRPRGQRDGPRTIQLVHDEGDARDAQAPRVRARPARTPRHEQSLRDVSDQDRWNRPRGAPQEGDGEMTNIRNHPMAALAVLVLGLFITRLDLTIINIAIPSILDGLHASLDQVLWMLNACSLLYAVLLITSASMLLPIAILVLAAAASVFVRGPRQAAVAVQEQEAAVA